MINTNCPRCEDLGKKLNGFNNWVRCPYFKAAICEEHCKTCKHHNADSMKCGYYNRNLTNEIKKHIERIQGNDIIRNQ